MADDSLPENQQWVIYQLRRPDGGVFYIGATKDLPRRLKEHRSVLGRDVVAETLERGVGPGRKEAEHRWIERFRAAGHTLLNKTAGGNGQQTLSPEAREALSRSTRGKKKSAEHRAKIGAAHRGKPKRWTPEGKASLREKGREASRKFWDDPSEAQLAAIAEGRKRGWDKISPEERSRRASERNKKVSRSLAAREHRIYRKRWARGEYDWYEI
jgi:hypothetical protein